MAKSAPITPGLRAYLLPAVDRMFINTTKGQPWSLTDVVLLLTVIVLFFVAGGLFTVAFAGDTVTTTVAQIFAKRPGPPECVIKGNISIETGEKIYHLPGMRDYASTRIRRRALVLYRTGSD